MGIRKDKLKDNFKKFRTKLNKDGFYVVLFICVCIVAVTSVYISNQNIKRYQRFEDKQKEEAKDEMGNVEDIFSDSDMLVKAKDKVIDVKGNVTKDDEGNVAKSDEALVEEDKKEIEDEKAEDIEEDANVEVAATIDTNKQEQLLKNIGTPVVGKINKKFAIDSLIYSETLEQWCVHTGVDIQADEGNAVKAVLQGKVIEVKTTKELGIEILIDHGEGIMTRYACLSTDKMVTVGKVVKKGDVISGIGKSVGFEFAQEAHLHFELILNGNYVNPEKYLPKVQRN